VTTSELMSAQLLSAVYSEVQDVVTQLL